MHDDADYVDGYNWRELALSEDPDLVQPDRDNNWKWIGGLTLTGVLIVLTWIICTTVASVSIVIPILVTAALFAPWVWLIERGNRHPH